MSRKRFLPFIIVFILGLNLAVAAAQTPKGERADEGKTNLPAMRVSTEVQVNTGACGFSYQVGRVIQQQCERCARIAGDTGQRLPE